MGLRWTLKYPWRTYKLVFPSGSFGSFNKQVPKNVFPHMVLQTQEDGIFKMGGCQENPKP